MRAHLPKPSPAMVVACLALFVSLTGTGVAVVKALPTNSVGTAQLKNNAVNSSKVANHSLNAADFATGQLQRVYEYSAATWGVPGAYGSTATAYCEPGDRVTGGGASSAASDENQATFVLASQQAPTGNGWRVMLGYIHPDGVNTVTARATVFCLSS